MLQGSPWKACRTGVRKAGFVRFRGLSSGKPGGAPGHPGRTGWRFGPVDLVEGVREIAPGKRLPWTEIRRLRTGRARATSSAARARCGGATMTAPRAIPSGSPTVAARGGASLRTRTP
ncbi:MAG: hypothetical protein LBP86_09965 [Azoarcus sp.]|nr:hypothetical protein [Azoarcus sp.]